MDLRQGISHHPAAGPLADVDHRVVHPRCVLEFPVEEVAVEVLCQREIVALQFDMDERICHD
jgi:hypothetical protein